MNEVFRVVLDIPGKIQFEVGEQIVKANEWNENECEAFLDEVRRRIDPNIVSRLGCIFVCGSLESAHEWYRRKANHCGCSYYVYKLHVEGLIEWHNSDYYDDLCLVMNKNLMYAQIAKRSKEENAALYWTEPVDPNSLSAEGLLKGCAVVVEKVKFNREGNQIVSRNNVLQE